MTEKQERNKLIADYYCPEKKTIQDKHGNWWFTSTPTGNKRGFPVNFNSLDSLVPVWEKLSLHEDIKINRFVPGPVINMVEFCKTVGQTDGGLPLQVFYKAEGETIQLAAALATVKAIKELK